MRFYPTKIHLQFLFSIFIALLVLISCSKDSDLLRDAVISETATGVDEVTEKENAAEEEANEEEAGEEEVSVEEEEVEVVLEDRTTSFPPINDAHFQEGKGFNQNIIRLEEGNRTSYLMFDVSAIESIDGQITEATLQFTISGDDGNGNITVYSGESNDWTEEDLAEASIPDLGPELGSITKEYIIGSTETISLDASNIAAEVNTLILDHQDGNDLAFASKEHATKSGPKLVLTYKAPIEAEEIVPPVEEPSEEENQEPIALADGSPSSGKAPLEVIFSGGNSSDDGEIKAYTWDFKDGTTSTQVNPTHIFNDLGTYEVVLTVEDDQGLKNSDIVVINVTNEENKAPIAVMSAAPKSGEAPLEVTFDGSQSTDDHGISSYTWDFKDGSSANTEKPVHTFTEPGTYEVELIIKDENGLSDSKDIIITVTQPENEAPVAVVSANKTSGEAPLTVQFDGDNSTDDKEVDSYSWDFKDGSNSTNANPSHTFQNTGTYAVELTVTDEEGLSNKKSITISVTESQSTNEAPVATATSNITSGEAPLQINFRGDQSTDDEGIVSYSWDFKDGSTSSEVNPSHTFQNPGTYQVAFTVTDADGATDTDIDTITVTEATGGNNGGNSNYPPNAVFASSFGFQAGDATEAFEDAINSGNSFIVIDKQSSDWVVQPTKFFDLDNLTIVFESGVKLRAKSGAFNSTNDVLVHLVRPRNLNIQGYGAEFKMNKSEYNSGEGRHAIKISAANGLSIKGLTIRDSGGDGIYIGRGTSTSYSRNITIEDVVSTNNRRQGMSIISAQDVWVRNSEFSNSSGASPEAGVDLEPNNSDERLVNINFSNCTFSNNDSHGFMIGTNKLVSSSTPISVSVIDSNFSNNSLSPPSSIKAELLLSHGSHSSAVKGTTNFERLNFNNSNNAIIFSRLPSDSYTVTFKDCDATNVLKSGSGGVIELQALSTENTLGGFTFDNFYIAYSSSAPFMKILAPNTSGFRVRDINGDFTIKEPNDYPIQYTGGYNSANNINVNIDYQHIN